MFKRTVITILALIVLLVAASLFLPRHARIERTATVAAPPAAVYTLVNGFKRFNEWSPWKQQDPNAVYRYSGPVAGVGARMEWEGDAKTVGRGSQTIVETRPDDLVRSDLDRGSEGKAQLTHLLSPAGDGATKVTWRLDTDLGFNPVSRWFGLLFLDRLMGPDLEKGLANLNALAATLPRADVSGLAAEITKVASRPIAFATATTAPDEQAVVAALGGALAQVKLFMTANGLTQAGPVITLGHRRQGEAYVFDVGIPIDRLPQVPVPPGSGVLIKGTYGGPVAKAVHKGAYSQLRPTADKLAAWVEVSGYQRAGDPWAEYVSDPAKVSEADLVTHVYVPVK